MSVHSATTYQTFTTALRELVIAQLVTKEESEVLQQAADSVFFAEPLSQLNLIEAQHVMDSIRTRETMSVSRLSMLKHQLESITALDLGDA